LEAIGDHLDKELKGLKALTKQPGQTQNDRLSRLIILSNDGSERFYHNVDSILNRHIGRAMACIVDATAEQLGDAFTKKANPAKALLIDERKALESFLATIVENR
jgi:putative sterol carrier protein